MLFFAIKDRLFVSLITQSSAVINILTKNKLFFIESQFFSVRSCSFSKFISIKTLVKVWRNVRNLLDNARRHLI